MYSLSPYLYVIISNVLSRMLNRATGLGQFGFHQKFSEVTLTHFSFADDIMIFTDGSLSFLTGIKKVFDDFATLPGLQINISKFTIFSAGKWRSNNDQAANGLGIPSGTLPICYLGLHLTTNVVALGFKKKVRNEVGYNKLTKQNTKNPKKMNNNIILSVF